MTVVAVVVAEVGGGDDSDDEHTPDEDGDPDPTDSLDPDDPTSSLPVRVTPPRHGAHLASTTLPQLPSRFGFSGTAPSALSLLPSVPCSATALPPSLRQSLVPLLLIAPVGVPSSTSFLASLSASLSFGVPPPPVVPLHAS